MNLTGIVNTFLFVCVYTLVMGWGAFKISNIMNWDNVGFITASACLSTLICILPYSISKIKKDIKDIGESQ